MAETESDYRVHLRSCSHPCALWPLGEGWQPLGEKGYKCYYLADWGPLCSHRLTGWMTLENRLTPSISSVFFLWPSRSPGHTLQCLLGVLSDPITMQSSWVSTGGGWCHVRTRSTAVTETVSGAAVLVGRDLRGKEPDKTEKLD